MQIYEYQEKAARTINKNLNIMQQRDHALFGLCSEVGEIQGIFQKHYQGHPISYDEMKKEVGDLLWFVAEFCTAYGWNMEDIARMNIDKLTKRYPEGFEEKKSINRGI